MQDLSVGKYHALAMLAALIGSLIGTVSIIVYEMIAFGVSRTPSLSGLIVIPVIAIISLIGTIPGALLVASPILFPFRHIIARHPLWSAGPVIVGGMLIAFAALHQLFGSPVLGYTDTDTEMLWSYSGSTALGFVVSLGWWGRRRSSKPQE